MEQLFDAHLDQLWLILCVAQLENKFMAQQDVSMPVHYSRYVDDIFCVLNSLEYVKMFLSFLNNIHPNLKLTCEVGPLKLAFLIN